MKKHLLLAAIGMLCLSGATAQSTETTVSWSGTLTPATQLVDGQRYLIYDASKIGNATPQDQDRNAMRYVSNGSSNIVGNHSITSSTANGTVDYLQYTFMAVADGSNWKFLHLGTGKFIQAVTNEVGTIQVNDNPGSWTVTYNENYSAFRVKSTNSNQCWDGKPGSPYNMCSWGGGATNDAVLHWYQFFNLEDNNMAKPAGVHDVSVVYPNGSKKIVGAVADGGNFTTSSVFSLNGAYTIDVPNNVTADTEVSAVATLSHKQVARLYFVNESKPLKYDGTETTADHTDNNTLAKPFLFYFKYTGCDDDLNPKYTLHNLVEGDQKGIQLNNSTEVATMTETPTELIYFASTSTDAKTQAGDFVLRDAARSTTWANNYYGNHKLASWTTDGDKRSDLGSQFRFSSLTEDDYDLFAVNNSDEDIAAAKANPTPEAINALLANISENVMAEMQSITNANKFIHMGLATDEAAATWTAFAKTISDLDASTAHDQVIAAYEALVASSANLSREVHIILASNKVSTDYACVRLVNNQFEVGRYGSNENANKTTLTLKPTEGGFKIYNEYSGKYLSFPISSEANGLPDTQTRVQPVDENEAGIFRFDLHDGVTGRYGVRTIATDTPNEHFYLHSNKHNGIVRWAKDDNSSWYIYASDEATATSEANLGANDDIANVRTNFAYTVGTAVGEYTASADIDQNAHNAAVNAVNAISNNASNAEKHAKAAALRATGLGKTFTINMPQAGHFYRLFGINTKANRVLTSTLHDSNNRLKIVNTNNQDGTNTDNRLETAFYFDGTHLVSVADGLVLNVDSHSKAIAANPATADETAVFEASNIHGAFYLKTNGRYLYNGKDFLDSGTGAGTDEAYRWRLTEITWLPIPESTGNYAAVNFPTPFTLWGWGHGSVKGIGYTAEFNGENVVLTQLPDETIPANTDVVIRFRDGVDRNENTQLVYIQPLAPEEGVENNLSQLTVTKADGSNYITLNGEKFVAEEGTTLRGFTTHFAVNEAHDYAMVDNKLNDVLTGAEGKVYTIANGSNFLTANGEELTVSNDGTNANAQWTIVNHEGLCYLYNLGAEKFAAAYNAHTAEGIEFIWHMDNYPTAVSAQWGDYTPAIFLADATLSIHGGQNAHNSKRPAGMMIADGKVPCISGVNAQDGNGFIFAEVAGANIPENLTAKIAEAKAKMTEAHDKFAEVIADENITEEMVGYFNRATMTAYHEVFQPVAEDDAEAKYYAYVRAKNSVTEPGYNEFAHNTAYNLITPEGTYYRAAATKETDGSYTLFAEPANIDTDDLSFNWRAVVNDDNTLTLTHTFIAPAGSHTTNKYNAPRRAPEGMEEYHVYFVKNATPKYDGLGNITVTRGEQTVTLKANSVAGNVDEITTAIREVEAAGEGNAETIYDLQGRRLNRALRGINIINGKKVLVK